MSSIRLDYSNVLADAVGEQHGITHRELDAQREPSRQALARVQARREADLRWLDLPYQSQVLGDVQAYTEAVRGRFRNVVVCGIGGSALGTIALHAALNGPYHDLEPDAGRRRLFVLDNVDPDWIGDVLDRLDPRETLVNVISKSGGTAETMSQFLLFRERFVDVLGSEGHKSHFVVTTDESRGVLREIVRREGYKSFVVPDGVGGRFSVLSPVGLVPAALVGIDVAELLSGAAAMDRRCRTEEFDDNPAQVHAAVQHLMHAAKGKPIAVTFAYSHALRLCADWYAQLLAESIGKRQDRDGRDVFRGPTPVRAVGVTDQHSQVQLYVEGPFDKWFTLLAVDRPERSVPIPLAYEDLEGVAYLGGRDLGELFQAERDGTRIALTEAGRPNATLALERVDAASVGALFQMLEVSVALMGEHYGVDAFDQPGVEAGKIAAYALMGRAGYEARRREIEEAASKIPPRTV
ncbi:MAG: glucose-6-phosphate isomerase [Planctomycetota bacterium]